MRTPTSHARGEVGINMTPMIDVVFQLIIFFLLASHLGQQETQTAVELPAAQSGRRTDVDDDRRVTVNVLDDGQYVISGRPVDQGELNRVLRFERAAVGPDLEVRVRCDRSVPYRHVEPIMVACTKAGVWQVTFAVIHE
jgi:biopolymer transport protein ExbD